MRLLLDLQACQASSMNRGIGRYSLALAHAIIRNGSQHDVRILVNGAFPDTAAALRKVFENVLPADAIRSFAIPQPTAEIDHSNRWRLEAAERIREHYLSTLRPDVVHIASLFEGLGDGTIASLLHGESCFDTAITLYDLIPLMRKERYLSDPNVAAWYHRKLHSLKNAELLLAISGNARSEAIEVLQVAPNAVVNISSAADDIFRPRTLTLDARTALLARHGLVRPFIMYTGGIDYRKNIEGLIEAYAALPGATRRDYQLAIVCSIQPPDRVRLQRLAASLQLAGDDVVLTGYVSDDDLVSLYNCTALFVFPSLHEGFGLPVLEAMACGAPVIASNSSSIPEVIGRADAMFDPTSVPEITRAMANVLDNAAFAQVLRTHGLAQAQLFTWDASAKRAISAFEATHAHRVAGTSMMVSAAVRSTRRQRLAFVSPLPPARSGIADYSAVLLPELAKYYEIDLILAQKDVDEECAGPGFAQRSVAWFDAHAHEFDRIVYQFGNSEFHSHMFGLLERHPGVVVLHDFFLSGALHYIDATSSPLPNYYSRMLYLAHGYAPLMEERTLGRAASFQAYPCNKTVLDRATGIIVHSTHALALARHWYGENMARDWRVLPLPRKLSVVRDQAAARHALAINADAVLFCSFGMLAPSKCIDAIVTAWSASTASHDPRCVLVFVGQLGDDDYGTALRMRIAAQPRIRITGHVDKAVYDDYLAAADCAIQLRTGSRGETSAAVLDCLAAGLPTIINAHGSAAEIADSACLRLDDAFSTDALRSAIDSLYEDDMLRTRLAGAARQLMESHSPEHAGALMHDAIEAFMRYSRGAAEQRLLQSLAAINGHGGTSSDRMQAAAAIADNRPAQGARTLLIDVTHLAMEATYPDEDAQHSLVSALIAAAPEGWRIEPVRHDGKRYRYARRFTLDLLGLSDLLIEDAVATGGAGDILLILRDGSEASLPPAWQARGIVSLRCVLNQEAAALESILAHLAAVPPRLQT